MKTKLIYIMLLSTLFALDSLASHNLGRMVVISDTHLLSPELVTPGSAIDRADSGDTKMASLSDDIMASLTDSIIRLQPQVVLITGDLTYNGERASHERMRQYLDQMASHGIKPLVIPGNHDCNNPFSKRFEGDHTVPVATVTRDEFAQIYRDYGYGVDVERDTASLSYCCEPIEGLVVIGIDSNMDELNTLTSRGDKADTYCKGGRIKAVTLQWIIGLAEKARAQGKHVIAMMHHHLVEHFDQQDRLLANYIVQDHDTIAQQFMQAGIHTIFTGHLHVTDAVSQFNAERTDSIVEVATGSAICYPFALRVIAVDQARQEATVETRWLTATATCPDLREKGRQRIINSTPGMAAMLSGKAWDKLGGRMGQLKAMLEMNGGKVGLPSTPQQATQLVLRHMSEVLSRAMLAVVEGNEQEQDIEGIIGEVKQGIHAMIEEVAPDQADNLWDFFQAEVYPKFEPVVRSVLEDRNAVGTPNESHTDDLRLTLHL